MSPWSSRKRGKAVVFTSYIVYGGKLQPNAWGMPGRGGGGGLGGEIGGLELTGIF